MHATLCDLMMDLVQNSVEANATEIELTLTQAQGKVEFSVKDNGNGMSKETQDKAVDPFYSDGKKHAHRRVGLGLPFLLQTADAVGGKATILSEEGRGTLIQFCAEAKHVDLPPVGNVASAATMMLSQPLAGDLKIVRSTDVDSYTLTRGMLADVLGDLNDAQNLTLMKTYIESQEENLEKTGTSYE
ncbi:MAG: ATP-binding protein [Kiritimatiellales bacterium]|nr:ATP-binding protein [Kiritimatiellota bacterium]MBL7012212.1 ATP-binding protein [Kiritimatiellales bacterium]